MSISRRSFVAGTIATAGAHLCRPAAAEEPVALPTIHVKKKWTLRVLGTHVTLQEPIRQQAEADLGIQIQFEPGGSAQVLHRASTRPESFDLYEQWSNSIRVLWQAGAIQPIDPKRIRYWEEINSLTKTGQLTPQSEVGAGDATHTLLYIQPDDALSCHVRETVSFLPYVHNVDAFGYNAAMVPRGTAYESESWSWLLDEQWAGKVAIINDPTIGLFDLVLAAQAKGLMQFQDIGNITRPELDQLFAILVAYRRRGHFRGVWSSVPESIKLMVRGEAYLQSMFSPAVFHLRGQGVDCVNASPREGYRAWHGVMCLSSKAESHVRDAAYEYMNWWLSGWPGAFIARQGYYISNPQRSRPLMSEAEWAFWYLGEPASEDLMGTDGQTVVSRGQIRDGGSYQKRFDHVAVWNTVMDNYEYSLARWNEFVSA